MELIDFHYRYRHGSSFRKKFDGYLGELGSLPVNRKTEKKRKALIVELLKLTNYNVGPFLGYYFPNYPDGRTPMTLRDYPFSYTFYDLNVGSTVTYRGSRQISKTTGLVTRQSINARLIPGWRSFTITPHSDQIKTYANKLKEAIEAFRFNIRNPNFRQNLYYREFKETKGTIKLDYVLTDASKIRGNTTDELIIEEAQDFDPGLEMEVEEIQSASDRPVTIYSGTSITTDTFLEHKYQESSKAVFMMKCPGCGHWNHPTIEGEVLKMIQPDGPCCVKCGTGLNVRDGYFHHTDKQALACGHQGYHIPKIIVPAIAENPRKWNRIYVQLKKTHGSSGFYQEILGIPTEEGSRELTEDEIKSICHLGSRDKVQNNARNRKYRFVVGACDWGGSEHRKDLKTKKSFTAHVALGITNDYKFDILLMDRYEGMSYKPILEGISNRHNEMHGMALGSDWGGGALYNTHLREFVKPETHWVFTYTGPNAKFLGSIEDSMFNHLTLNKTESISSLFEAIKTGRIRCYNWEEAAERLSECLSIYRAPHETTDGKTYMCYRRHPSKPDDIAQALNLAYTVGRIVIGEPIFEDKALMARVRQVISGGRRGMDEITGGLVYG